MPSFFQALKRFMQGKPVFDPGDNQTMVTKDHTPPPPLPPIPVQETPKLSSIRKGDSRTFPVVEIRRTTTRLSGQTMQIYCYIRNHSSEEIELDKIRFLDTIYEIDSFLRPGEEREYRVYSGPILTHEDHDPALLQYKTKRDGDYFEAAHDIKFRYNNADKTYTVEALQIDEPIRDIYG